MATSSNIKIVQYGLGRLDRVRYPVAAAVEVAKGDLLEDNAAGTATIVDAAENPVFIGVAEVGSAGTGSFGPKKRCDVFANTKDSLTNTQIQLIQELSRIIPAQ